MVCAGAVANWRAECVSQVTVCTVRAVHRSAVTSWDPGIDAHTAVCAAQVGMALCQPAGGGDWVPGHLCAQLWEGMGLVLAPIG